MLFLIADSRPTATAVPAFAVTRVLRRLPSVRGGEIVRLADPKPALCSVCANSGDASGRYIDFEADFDGPVVLNERGEYRLDPNGAPAASENIYLCERCVESAARMLEIRPELHRQLLNRIAEQQTEIAAWRVEVQHWKDMALREKSPALEEPPEPVRRGPGRPRKVIA